jgi:hypothetical protein
VPTLADRLADLESQGRLTAARRAPADYTALRRRHDAPARPGALARFLDERD